MQVQIKHGKLQHISPAGFGFLQVVQGDGYVDKFFHISSVLSGEPVVGCEVEYSDGFARGRTCAMNVRFLPVPVISKDAATEVLERKEDVLSGGN
jgi:cold shock CspA family protein